MAEIYFDHPSGGAHVASDTSEAEALISKGWTLRNPQPHGLKVPASLEKYLAEQLPVQPTKADPAETPEPIAEPVAAPKKPGPKKKK